MTARGRLRGGCRRGTRREWIPLISLGALLMACRGDSDVPHGEDSLPPVAAPGDSATQPPAAVPPGASAEDVDVVAATAVIRGYYEAIDAGDVAYAYEQWGDSGRSSGQSYDEFAAGFADTEHVAVTIHQPGRVEGAAGSRYIEIPVTVTATTRAGDQQLFEGTYTLRRVVVDGARPEQRRWHLDQGRLREVGGEP